MRRFFVIRLMDWYSSHCRTLPWREQPTPYRVLVSEFMLQQTQVPKVKEKFREFIAAFPAITDLANASKANVIQAWSGMGYNRRALLLQKFAQAVVKDCQGIIPDSAEKLRKLPGIGAYTAGAIASFAYNKPEPAIDVNIRRVYMRYFHGKDQGMPLSIAKEKQLYALVKSTIPRGKSRELHNALMDFGSLVCTRKAPLCTSCPLKKQCSFFPLYTMKKEKALFVMEKPREKGAYEKKKFIPNRIFRGRIVEYARRHDGGKISLADFGKAIKEGFSLRDEAWLLGLCRTLEKEGLLAVEIRGNGRTIALRLPE